jgi:PPOX class probable FMN-dependent enzyme
MNLDHVVVVRSASELEAVAGPPSPQSANKVRSTLGEWHRKWLAISPFCLIATAAADGSCDVSPRGDQPGFVVVVDERTIAVLDHPGSRRFDGFKNVLTNPHAGLISLIPGRADALRINGRATVVRDAPFFDDMALGGARPAMALVIEVHEVFLHHSRSFVRSGIWDSTTWSSDALPPEVDLAKLLEDVDAAEQTLSEPKSSGTS